MCQLERQLEARLHLVLKHAVYGDRHIAALDGVRHPSDVFRRQSAFEGKSTLRAHLLRPFLPPFLKSFPVFCRWYASEPLLFVHRGVAGMNNRGVAGMNNRGVAGMNKQGWSRG